MDRTRPARGRSVRPLLLCLPLLLLPLPGRADEDGHDRARAALQAGEVAPLGEILAVLAARGAGQVLEVELEQHGDRWIYEIETLGRDGVISEYAIDAVSKEILDDPETRGEDTD